MLTAQLSTYWHSVLWSRPHSSHEHVAISPFADISQTLKTTLHSSLDWTNSQQSRDVSLLSCSVVFEQRSLVKIYLHCELLLVNRNYFYFEATHFVQAPASQLPLTSSPSLPVLWGKNLLFHSALQLSLSRSGPSGLQTVKNPWVNCRKAAVRVSPSTWGFLVRVTAHHSMETALTKVTYDLLIASDHLQRLGQLIGMEGNTQFVQINYESSVWCAPKLIMGFLRVS